MGAWWDGPSWANSINNAGQVVGAVEEFGFYWRATLFDATGDGNNIRLDDRDSSALAINDAGQIVGWAWQSFPGLGLSIMFNPTGAGSNINLIDRTTGWSMTMAREINKSGWIVGYGRNPHGEWHAFLLVPEPATFALLGLAILYLRRCVKAC